MIEQILNVNYLPYNIGSNKYNDTDMKLSSSWKDPEAECT